ncbi:MAG: selenium cofactor biosynthesis protein YqeC, partial [Clostridiales bacterium]
KDQEVIVLTGGGGKTSMMFALCRELSQTQARIIATTTTKIMQPRTDQVDRLITGNEAHILSELQQGIAPGEIVAVLAAVNEDCKSVGISPDLCNQIMGLGVTDYLIIEADGAARKPFKAPAAHEPVIPDCCTTLINICGIDALNTPLDQEHCHRPELIAQLTGLAIGDTLSAADMATVINSAQGGKKGLPPGARFIVVINKADDQERIVAAQKLSAQILNGGTQEVVIAAVGRGHTVIERQRAKPLGGIILAAGCSTRMGQNKLLLPWGKDNTILGTVIDHAQEAGIFPLYVVTGADSQQVASIAESKGISWVYNPDYAAGQSGSLQKGLSMLPEYMGAMFILGDQPLIAPWVYQQLIDAYQRCDSLIVTPCDPQGNRGNPNIFGPQLRAEIFNLQGDTGARTLFEKYAAETAYITITDQSICIDIDNPVQYKTFRRSAYEGFN